MAGLPPTNSLGLDFTAPDAEPSTAPEQPSEAPEPTPPQSPQQEQPQRDNLKKKPYVNPDRVKTGGPQREKLSDEALAERMARMREQNEKIKQRRLDVAADEAAFKQTQDAERQKMARTRKIQDNIDKAREQNVKRKMDRAQNREWDSGKPAAAAWKESSFEVPEPHSEGAQAVGSSDSQSPVSPRQPQSDNRGREGQQRGGRSRGRGRGRGGRSARNNPGGEVPIKEKQAGEGKEVEKAPASASSPAPS